MVVSSWVVYRVVNGGIEPNKRNLMEKKMQKEDRMNSLERRYHRISEWLRREGTSGCHLVQLLLKQGHLEQVAEDCVYLSSECLQGWRFLISLDTLRQCSVTFTVKKCLLLLRKNLLCFNLCPVPLVQYTNSKETSCTGKWWKKKKIQIRLEKNRQNLMVSPFYCSEEWNESGKTTRIVNEVVRSLKLHKMGKWNKQVWNNIKHIVNLQNLPKTYRGKRIIWILFFFPIV